MRWIGLGAAAICLAAGARGQDSAGQDPRLTKVLAQLDAAAAKFGSAQADFSWDQYTAVVQEHDVQTGTIAFSRTGKSTAMVAHVLKDNGQAAQKDVLYKDKKLVLYQPGIKQETIIDAGANSSQVESFATLGFGGSGKDLQANWNISYEGADTLEAAKVVELGLTPKNPGPNPLFTKIDIWVDPEHATSVKQVFTTPSGDNRTALYTKIVLNQVPESAFKLDIPKDAAVVRPK